jgi:hypothetical protein
MIKKKQKKNTNTRISLPKLGNIFSFIPGVQK